MGALSMDARMLIGAFFSGGEKHSLKIGGEGAQSVLSDRAAVAMDELIAGGYVRAEEFNQYGRMLYTGTEKCVGQRPSMDEVEMHGGFTATKPNPELVA